MTATLNLSSIDVGDTIGRLQGAESPDDLAAIIGDVINGANVNNQLLDVLNLTSAQQTVLEQYCEEVGSISPLFTHRLSQLWLCISVGH